jgi:tetratricopeptide (TPR) repeat protein
MPIVFVRNFIQLFLFLGLLFSANSLEAQAYIKQYKKALVNYEEGRYQQATHHLNQALLRNENYPPALFLKGNIERLTNNYLEAAKSYNQLIQVDSTYETYRAHLYLGLTLKQAGDYELAFRTFKKMNFEELDKESIAARKLKIELIACNWIWKDHVFDAKTPLRPIKIINTVEPELSPYLFDDTTLVFTEIRGINELDKSEENSTVLIRRSVKQAGKWIEDKALQTTINKPGIYSANASWNEKKQFLYFSRCLGEGECNVYFSYLNDSASFLEAKPIEGFDQFQGNISNPSFARLSNGRAVLFFSSNVTGGFGGYDIYQAYLNSSETAVSKIENLGNIINTPEDEITPFYFSKDSTLYFSSNWHPGLGGQDIFMAKSHGELVFDTIYNIGYPFNGPSNDVYFMLRNDSLGVLASNRIEAIREPGSTCCNDIFEFKYKKQNVVKLEKIPSLNSAPIAKHAFEYSIEYSKQQVQKMIPVALYFYNDEPDPKTTKTTTSLSYENCYNDYLVKEDEFYGKLETDEDINSFFTEDVQYNYERLNRFLDELEVLMIKGVSVELKIKGYASPLAQSNYNLNLTKRRISSLENYITSYNNGALIHYLNTNPSKLVMNPFSFGEKEANKNVSDDASDKAKSIYSLAASKERRIEIEAIKINDLISARSLSLTPYDPFFPTSPPNYFNAGYVKPYRTKRVLIPITNPYDEVLNIKKVTTGDGIVIPLLKKQGIYLKSGETGYVEVAIKVNQELGKQEVPLIIESKNWDFAVKLNLSFEVLP